MMTARRARGDGHIRNRGTDAAPRWFAYIGHNPQRSSGRLPTKEAAKVWLAEQKNNRLPQDPPLAPLTSFADYSVIGMVDLVKSGVCTPMCLFGEDDECICRCGGKYHARALHAAAVVSDEEDCAGDPLAALRSWKTLTDQLEALVAAARQEDGGHTWDEIGQAVGIDPSTLRRRYGERYPRPGWNGRHRLVAPSLSDVSQHHRDARDRLREASA